MSVFNRLSEKAVMSLLNVAAPAPDISIVNAVIADPPSLPLTIKSLSCTPVVITKSLDVLDNVAIVVPPSLNSISPPSASNVISAAASIVKLLALITKSVPSPSIFSEAPPNCIPTLLGITTSAVAVRLILLPAIVKSVPSPSIFSPSSPNVIPTFAGTLISVVAVKLISLPELNVKSVPFDSIFSLASVKSKTTLVGITISVVAVKFNKLLEENQKNSVIVQDNHNIINHNENKKSCFAKHPKNAH